MFRFLAAVLAVAAITVGMSVATIQQSSASVGITGTYAEGNTYRILWVRLDDSARVVRIAGRRARDVGGVWEVVLRGTQRDRDVRRVEVLTTGHYLSDQVRFTEVKDW